jgi:hypothetical protein
LASFAGAKDEVFLLYLNIHSLNFCKEQHTMKKIFFIVILLFPLVVRAQIDDLLKKTVVPDLLEEKNVTTSLSDAYPEAFWLENLDKERDPIEPADYSFNLAPGYYRFNVQSYCLKAGTHASTKGAGHLVAPIKGKRGELVINIITRSADHPDIAQHDIQLLLWSIIYGAKFTDLEKGVQLRVSPLLTPEEITDLSIGIKDVPVDLLPDELKASAKFYKDLRHKITDPASSYEDVERMAVIPGDPPADMLLKQINPGNWAYVGDGFYMRIMPDGYQRSVLDVYRAGKVNVTRDDKQRITSIERDGYKTEVTYVDEPGSDVMFADGKYYPIYRFKSVKYTGPNAGEEFVQEDIGWIVRGDGKEVSNPSGTYKNYPQDPSLAVYKARVADANEVLKKLNKYRKDPNRPSTNSLMDITDEFNANKHMKDGLDAVKDPSNLKDKGKWINKNNEYTTDWFNCASNALAGGSCDDNNDPKKMNPGKNAGSPGNSAGQRIAPSMRKYGG